MFNYVIKYFQKGGNKDFCRGRVNLYSNNFDNISAGKQNKTDKLYFMLKTPDMGQFLS